MIEQDVQRVATEGWQDIARRWLLTVRQSEEVMYTTPNLMLDMSVADALEALIDVVAFQLSLETKLRELLQFARDEVAAQWQLLERKAASVPVGFQESEGS